MKTYGDYVFKKEVDKSLLTEGFNIPLDYQVVFKRNLGNFLKRGESKEITLYINERSYKAQIKNQKYDDKLYNRKDIVQVRYNKTSDIANEFRRIFNKSFQYINIQRQQKELMKDFNQKIHIKLPEDIKEYLLIYTTEYEDTYFLDSIVADDISAINQYEYNQPERVYEESFNYDVTDKYATIVLDERLVKIKKYNSSIGKNLKTLYDYRCQICGKKIGEDYDAQIIEAHHISPFVKSLNNDMKNIMIVCPNHHSIIHDVNPNFNKTKKIFTYSNGFVEGLKLNFHL
ncbi:MAG: HNH endonuclease signature motif containing protein [Sedimentibacter sp.]|uniref:HNH endonuclease signature motif containing protein n=1 Tax=Sedimentibacter sp. TaxID=1960295 RepID=UPI0029812495|nr:HNH endonuclease signature motif containing protein [Sedimentibacter sp.]MDW5300715.1 HNH endonuclease signature motif containing protein [Sedimentibacter sp.]